MSFENSEITSSLLNSGLVARFRHPAGNTRSPGLLVLGGAEGGLESADAVAQKLVDEGFATLALAYFGDPHLPSMLGEIPLEYFHKAIDWLREAPGIDGGRVGVIGHSKGAEAALLIGATTPHVAAVFACAPSHVAWQAMNRKSPAQSSWTYRGVPVPFVRYVRAEERMQREGVRGLYAASLEANPDAVHAAEIPVERTRGAILLASGGQDGIWPSSEMARSIMKRLRISGFAYPYHHLDHPDAGHAILRPPSDAPTAKAEWEEGMGGTDAGNAAARGDGWNKLLIFLRDQLR